MDWEVDIRRLAQRRGITIQVNSGRGTM